VRRPALRGALALVAGVVLLEVVLHLLDWPRVGDEPLAHLLEQIDRRPFPVGDRRWAEQRVLRLDPELGVHPECPSDLYGADGTRVERHPGAAGERTRLLLLGDSVVYRPGVFEALEAELRDTHAVYEAGVEGFDLRAEFAWLRRYAVRCEPEVVVLLMHVNDYWCSSQIFRDVEGRLVHYHRHREPLVVSDAALTWSRLYRYWVRARIRPERTSPDELIPGVDAQLRELAAWCTGRDIELRVGFLPLLDFEQNAELPVREFRAHALATLAELDVHHVDLEPALKLAASEGVDLGEDPEHPPIQAGV
jgi:hypothetical protein